MWISDRLEEITSVPPLLDVRDSEAAERSEKGTLNAIRNFFVVYLVINLWYR